jgi:hypothetical protein
MADIDDQRLHDKPASSRFLADLPPGQIDGFVSAGSAAGGGFTLKSIGTLTRVITSFPF